MGKKKTKEQFVQELNSIIPEVELIGDFINVNVKTDFRCLRHNCLFGAYPINMLHGHTGCRDCSREKYTKVRSKSQEQFVKDVKDVNPNIDVIGDYVNVNTKVLVRCSIDGYEWFADPRKLLRGAGCPVCANKVVLAGVNDVATTHSEYVKYFKNPDDATKYVAGSLFYIDAICPECGVEKRIRVSNLIRFGLACNECYNKRYGRYRVPKGYWNADTMQEYLDQHYHGYSLLDSFMATIDSGTALKALIKCPNPSHEPYWVYWKNILSGYMCYMCYLEDSMSHGEHMSESVFVKYNIKYESQKRFEDCRDTYTLPFDFYLPDYNLVVEIMGEQHEHPVEFFGGNEGFEKRIAHDKFKRDYLKNHNIACLDIWYYEFNNMEELILNKIQEILNNTKLMCAI